MVGADGREYVAFWSSAARRRSRRRRLMARWVLSQREAEVLTLVGQNKSGPEIAILLSISHETVRKHMSHIFEKLGLETRAAAAAVARELS